MKNMILFCAFSMLTIGCSTQYRTADYGVNSEQLIQWLNDATTSAQAVGGSNNDIVTLANAPGTTIYFADTGTQDVHVQTVMAFDNIDWLDSTTWIGSVKDAQVFFLDNSTTGAHQNALVVGIATTLGGQLTYKTFSGSGTVTDGEFDFAFVGADGRTYHATTLDLDGDNLASDIQLKLFTTDDDGAEVYVGKFSILEGFQ